MSGELKGLIEEYEIPEQDNLLRNTISQKRVENSHNEYTKAKEFFVNHKNDEE